VTRGAEGLLELTCVKTISLRHGHMRPRYQPTTAGAGTLFRQDLRAAHGPGWVTRLRAGAALLAALVRRAHPCRRAAVGGTTRLQSK
jgi:hypothetical protein